jgi:hypothetical protein
MSIEVHDRVIRLDEKAFQGLVAGGQDTLAQQQALAVPGVGEALEAVRAPLAVVNIDVSSPAVHQTHRAWVDPEAAALLLAVHGDERQLLAAPPALLASGLARVLRIGPRRVGARAPQPAEPDVLADLYSETEILRRSAFDALAAGGAVHRSPDGGTAGSGVAADFAWSIGLSSAGEDRWLSAVDGPDGIWLVAGDEHAPRLEPVTATEVWRRLTTLLRGL